MKKLILFFSNAFLSLFLVAGIFLGTLLFSSFGFSTGVGLLQHLAPEHFRATWLSGHLGTPIILKDIDIRLKNYRLQMGSFTLDWDLPWLLKGIWAFNTIEAEHIRIEINPEFKESSTVDLEMPKLMINTLELKDIIWVNHEKTTLIQRVHLTGSNNQGPWDIRNLTIETELGNLEGYGLVDYGRTAALHLGLKNLNIWHPVLGNGNRQIKIDTFAEQKDGQWLFSGEGHLGIHPIFLEGSANRHLNDIKLNLFCAKPILYDNQLNTKIELEPHLSIHYNHQQVGIFGDIQIIDASVRRSHIEEAVYPSSDVHVIQQPLDPNLPAFIPTLKVNIHLGERFFFSGYGLTTLVKGDLLVEDTPHNFLKGTGQLSFIKGEYQSFGRVFKIKQGYLQYHGVPLTEPQLLIDAERTLIPTRRSSSGLMNQESITVGIHIEGLASEPSLKLYSNPTLSENDILSYLVFNHPQSETTAAQADALLQAANSLSTWAGQKTRTFSNLPFDDLHLERQDNGFQSITQQDKAVEDPLSQTSLAIGKQVNDKLYIQYNAGMIDSLNSLRIQYQLGKHWSIEGNTGVDASGADIVWSLEK